ncbi:MAG: hypothetical protein AB7E51_17545 [Pseudodesulfovibrio sp.]|uniref:hypothetical protein n=1 Tax=Pseudodesulfovibrio sp. TaxID=2035812 RepID=UPI003D0C09DF
MYLLKCIANSGYLVHAVILLTVGLIVPLVFERGTVAIPLCIALCLSGGGMMWHAYQCGETVLAECEQAMNAERVVGALMRGKNYQCEVRVYGVRSVPCETLTAIHRQYTWNPLFIRHLLSEEDYSTAARYENLLLVFTMALGSTANTIKIEIFPFNEQLANKP